MNQSPKLIYMNMNEVILFEAQQLSYYNTQKLTPVRCLADVP